MKRLRSRLQQIAFSFILAWAIVNTVLWYVLYDELRLNDERFLDLKSCPLCFGFTLCRHLQFDNTQYSFQLENDGYLLNTYTLQSLFNVKNVFALFERKSGRRMILKKLAHDSELAAFDSNEKECKEGCIGRLIEQNKAEFEAELSVEVLKKASAYLNIEFLSCFNERLVNLLKKSYIEHDFTESGQNHSIGMHILLATLNINPEPIVMQMFSSIQHNLPFPEYIGSCGRVIVETNEGQTLSKLIHRPFLMRLKISRLLLESLLILEENMNHVSVYFLDLGLDNVAYNENDHRIYFIDLENLILVDKTKFDSKDQSSYFMKFNDCGGQNTDCLYYSINSMCTKRNVDINYYSVCRSILSPMAAFKHDKLNFLHSIPVELERKFKIGQLLNSCADPPVNTTRLELVNTLINIFKQIENIA